jgi:hypothetical protein
VPGLLRGVACTAVVASTATTVSNRVSRRQAERWQQQGSSPSNQPGPASAEQPASAGPAQQPPPAAPSTDPMIQQLKDLAALRDQGVLTEEEFAAQKARILGA